MIQRKDISNYVELKYKTIPENTFSKFPEYCVLRHKNNEKWYGLIMNISKNKLGIDSEGETDIIDLKVGSGLVGSLISKDGYYPAYHMNKEHWISVDLNSKITSNEIEKLIDISYNLTN
ncbi:MmcQ/YjbR family DNA-binding protein [Enterococcus sp. AZ103]|uniref:MmcQ/YjbR family DNA-binding protein n=1 Tax=Enterococcus sp. AZ103 TaxID=2774628 RepID=UPI003F2221A3